MAKTLQRRATYDDLVNVPPHLVAEIIEGELHTSPRPRSRHGNAAFRLSTRLGGRFDDDIPGGWRFQFEPELHLRNDVLVPDIAGWRRERMPELPDVAAFELVPDWVCEIVSASNARHDRYRKAPRYASHGVAHGWIVDPVACAVEAYRLENGRWALIGTYLGDDAVRIEPFEDLELPLGILWR
jgi:Uma2 family endonuclease